MLLENYNKRARMFQAFSGRFGCVNLDLFDIFQNKKSFVEHLFVHFQYVEIGDL